MLQVMTTSVSAGIPMHLDPSAFVADSELVEALSRRAVSFVCDSDRVLFRQGETPNGIYLVQQGMATLSMAAASGERILEFDTTAGALLGLPGLVSNQPYTLTALARAGARIGFISNVNFAEFMKSSPSLGFKILQVLAAEVSAARRAMSE